jgi:hypothetical protein
VYPGYATPTFTCDDDGVWLVHLSPWNLFAGRIFDHEPTGWSAYAPSGRMVGLFPDKQAAGEALVRHAGYEVLTQ